MKYLTAIILVVALLTLSQDASADYLPDEAFIAHVADLLKSAPVIKYGELPSKEIVVGTRYQPGEVAYFILILDPQTQKPIAWKMQFEEYILLKDTTTFHVIFWEIFPNRTKTWSSEFKNGGTYVIGSGTPEREILPDSPEAIAMSEYIQKIIKRAGHPA